MQREFAIAAPSVAKAKATIGKRCCVSVRSHSGDTRVHECHTHVSSWRRAIDCAHCQRANAIQCRCSRCSSPEYRQFDFGLANGTLAQGDKPAGRNSVRSILNGCAISEEWSGTGGFKGNSLNFYSADTKRWHQTWIDSQGQSLALSGQFDAGSMTLQSTPPDTFPRHRITWTPTPDKSVRQLWQVQDAPGTEWKTLFDGRYSARPASAPNNAK